MDASALLTSQGWRGKGHSLHKTDDSIGLAKPLLLNRKDNTKGLGTTAHFTSDQWWMNAFDEQLKGLETAKDGKLTQTVKTGKLNAIEKGSLGKYSLYLSFVRGGFLEGTVPTSSTSSDVESSSDETPATSEPEKTADNGDKTAAREEKRRRKEERATRRKERAERRAKKAAKKQGEGALESKEERRARREGRRKGKEEKANKTANITANEKAERRRTKEERRARKEMKRREQSKAEGVSC